MLTVGVNSYVTLDEAVMILKTYKRDISAFLKLGTMQREQLLLGAALNIDTLVFSGFKSDKSQAMEFPRNGTNDIPFAVKAAQVLEAFSFTDEKKASRESLRRQGVKSVSIGDVSESYDSLSLGENTVCDEAFKLLRKYTAGSVRLV